MFEFLFGRKKKKAPVCKKYLKSKKTKPRKKRSKRTVKSKIKKEVAQVIHEIEARGGSPVEAAEAAAAVAADISEQSSKSPEQVIKSVQETAVSVAESTGGSPQEVQEAVDTATERAIEVVSKDTPPVATAEVASVLEQQGVSPEQIQEITDSVGSTATPAEIVKEANKVSPGLGTSIAQGVVSFYSTGFSLMYNAPSLARKIVDIASKGVRQYRQFGKSRSGKYSFGSCKKCQATQFGRRCKKCHRMNFGASICSVRQATEEDCTNYVQGGLYPCFLKSNGCAMRIDKQDRHQRYTTKKSRSPVVQEVLASRSVGTQTSPPTSPIRRVAAEPIATQTEAESELAELVFGKSRKPRKGRKGRKSRKGRKARKPSKKLIKMCRKHKVKCTKKVGGKRVYKSITTLKKQLRRKMKK